MPGTKEQSKFVTVVAWILIVLSGVGTLASLLQTAMLPAMLRGGLAFVATATTLVVSIGLLRRANWARLVVTALMILGIAWTVGGLVLEASTLWSVREQVSIGAVPAGILPMMAAIGLAGILFAGVLGWIAKRLMSPRIAADFR